MTNIDFGNIASQHALMWSTNLRVNHANAMTLYFENNTGTMRIKISTYTPDFPAIRQTPGSKGVWGDCEFVGNESEECDFWVVYEKLPKEETTLCPEGNTLFITGEPPSVKWYNPVFLRQFETVLTTHRKILHRHIILGQTALPWIIGAKYSAKEKNGNRTTTSLMTSSRPWTR